MKKIINILGFILIISSVILSIILFFQNQTFKKEISVLNSRISELQKENQETDRLISEGWVGYVDKKYKFKLWYPGEDIRGPKMIYTDDSNTSSYRSFSIDCRKLPEGCDGNGRAFNLLDVYIYNKDITDIKKFIPEELSERRGTNISGDDLGQNLTQDKISGIDAYKFKMSENFINYYIKKDGLMFVLVFDTATSPEDYPELSSLRPYFDEIVKTFRFTE